MNIHEGKADQHVSHQQSHSERKVRYAGLWKVPVAVLTMAATLGVTSPVMWAGTGSGAGSSGTSGSSTSTATNSTSADSSQQGLLSKDKAIQIASQLVTVPNNFTLQGANLQSQWGQDQQDVYNIVWNGSNPRQPGFAPGMANVVMDAHTGQVLNIMENTGNSWAVQPTISEADAAAKADKLMKKLLLPKQYAEMARVPLNGVVSKVGGSFSFRYVRMVNGIPVPFESAMLTLNGQGNIASYVFNWTDAKFPAAPDKSTLTSMDKATATYKSALQMHLAYASIFRGGDNPPDYILSYQSGSSVFNRYMGPVRGPWIDAETGRLMDATGQPTTVPAPVTYTPLVKDGPTQYPTEQSSGLDGKGADALARKQLGISDAFTLQNTGHGSSSGQGWSHETYNLTYVDKSTNASINVEVDATTHQITNYNRMMHRAIPMGSGSVGYSTTSSGSTSAGNGPQGADLKKDQAAAEAFVEKVLPSMTGAIALTPQSESGRMYVQPGSVEVPFTMLLNGYPWNQFFVMVDASTHQITSFAFFPGNPPKVSTPTSTITAEQATDSYVKQYPLQLEYVLPQKAGQAPAPNGQVAYASEAMLVYAPSMGTTPQLLNAETGKWVDEVPGRQAQEPTDTAGHAGAADMNLLAERGILPEQDGKVHPDATVTRAEFADLFEQAIGMYYGNAGQQADFADVPRTNKYFNDVEQGVYQGWLPKSTNFYPNNPVNHLDVATWVTNFLGWGDLAKTPGLFANQFSDVHQVPANLQGAADIAVKTGVLSTDNGKLNPYAPMTVADVSEAIVRAMQLNQGSGQ